MPAPKRDRSGLSPGRTLLERLGIWGLGFLLILYTQHPTPSTRNPKQADVRPSSLRRCRRVPEQRKASGEPTFSQRPYISKHHTWPSQLQSRAGAIQQSSAQFYASVRWHEGGLSHLMPSEVQRTQQNVARYREHNGTRPGAEDLQAV